MRLIAAAETDRGIVKDSNQDSLCFELAETSRGSAALAIVCDGMGGLQKGEVASAAVMRQFSDWFETEFPRQFEAFDWRSASAQWEHMIQVAAQKLAEYGAANGVRLGTTVSAMLIYENHYLIAHVGDSRIYEITDRMVQMTEDQTLVAREVRQGLITAEQAEHDPRRNVLLQCVGASKTVRPTILTGTIRRNACYLFCSDGLRHEVSAEELMRYTSPAVSDSKAGMQRNLRSLIELVKQRGEEDNLSALLVRTMD